MRNSAAEQAKLIPPHAVALHTWMFCSKSVPSAAGISARPSGEGARRWRREIWYAVASVRTAAAAASEPQRRLTTGCGAHERIIGEWELISPVALVGVLAEVRMLTGTVARVLCRNPTECPISAADRRHPAIAVVHGGLVYPFVPIALCSSDKPSQGVIRLLVQSGYLCLKYRWGYCYDIRSTGSYSRR